MPARHQRCHDLLTVVLGAALLMVPALLNGFPFIFPDSTDYLTIAPQLHRLPFYGLFITFFHLNQFIWMPVVAQSLIVSHLLFLLMQRTIGKPSPCLFALFMAALTAFTSLPFFTGFIMADIFTPVMFLTYYLLCFHHRQLSFVLRLYLFLLACVATVTHLSNLSLSIGLLILFAMLLPLSGVPLRARLRPLALITGSLVLSISAILLFHGVIFGKVELTPAGQSFFMANLIEHGPARQYLREACPDAGYKLCNVALPNTAEELLWYTGIYQKLGGFAGMKEEAATIVRETIARYPTETLTMVIENFGKGLVTHEPAAEFYAAQQIPAFSMLLEEKFGEDDVRAFHASAEMRDTIPHALLGAIDSIVTPLCFLLLIVIALYHIRHPRPITFTLATATFCFILGNTLLCTTLSGVHDRYQSRVTWLAAMVVLLVVLDYWKKKRAHA